jgi:threonine 3-dehydrogenase
MDQYGHGRGTMHGGCSQFSIVPSKYCYQLKHNITTNEAVLLEPMGKKRKKDQTELPQQDENY